MENNKKSKTNINYPLILYSIFQNKYNEILKLYLSSERAFKKEDYEIDIGVSDFSTYYFELRFRRNKSFINLNKLEKKLELNTNRLINEILNKFLIDDVIYIIKFYIN